MAVTMYDADLIRKVCAEITKEKDPKKVEELLLLMRSVVADETDEARTRAAILRHRTVSDRNAAD
jgi:hypothetical protein